MTTSSIVITSDWHIGARLASAGPAAPAFREAKFRTAERIIRLTREEDARALFLLGDTFEGDRVGAGDVQRVAELLATAPCPVYILPGNHDWWHPGGALQAFGEYAKINARIQILLKEEPLAVDGIPGVTFYPCPVLRHAGVADPTRWIPARRPEDGTRVALIHGALDRAGWGGTVPENVAQVRDLDLALLGDWHKPVDGPDGRTHYAGSPEPAGFDEEHDGQVIVVGFESDRPVLRRVSVGERRWKRIELKLESETMGGAGTRALDEALTALTTSPAVTALRLRLSGNLHTEEMSRLEGILSRVSQKGWAACEIDSQVTCALEPSIDAFEEESIRIVARRIWESDKEEIVRRRALSILKAKVEAAR